MIEEKEGGGPDMHGLNIAENIIRLRHVRKITQKDLADFIGVTKASVSKWESGASDPSPTNLTALADLFKQHRKISSKKSDKKRLPARSLYHLQNGKQIVSC